MVQMCVFQLRSTPAPQRARRQASQAKATTSVTSLGVGGAGPSAPSRVIEGPKEGRSAADGRASGDGRRNQHGGRAGAAGQRQAAPAPTRVGVQPRPRADGAGLWRRFRPPRASFEERAERATDNVGNTLKR